MHTNLTISMSPVSTLQWYIYRLAKAPAPNSSTESGEPSVLTAAIREQNRLQSSVRPRVTTSQPARYFRLQNKV